MKKILWTAIHHFRQGTSHYIFAIDMPDGTPDDWRPDIAAVIELLEIDFEQEREEWIEIERQGSPNLIVTIPFDARPTPKALTCDECGQDMAVNDDSTTNHLKGEGVTDIDYDADIDHVAYHVDTHFKDKY